MTARQRAALQDFVPMRGFPRPIYRGGGALAALRGLRAAGLVEYRPGRMDWMLTIEGHELWAALVEADQATTVATLSGFTPEELETLVAHEVWSGLGLLTLPPEAVSKLRARGLAAPRSLVLSAMGALLLDRHRHAVAAGNGEAAR